MIPPLAIAGAVIGGLYLVTDSGLLTPGGPAVVQEEHAGTAITKAMQTLLASRPLAGVSWSQDAARPLSATANYGQMLNAMIGYFGQADGATRAPHGVSNDQLVEIATKWLAAYDAGRAADGRNFQFTTSEAADTLFGTGCADTRSDQRTSLGNAACDLASYRDQVAAGAASVAFTDPDEVTIEMFRRINALAAEMDGADYTVNGVRNSDQDWKYSDIPGGIVAAGEASLSFVEGLAGKAASTLGAAIVGSDLFWLGVIGFAGYFALR